MDSYGFGLTRTTRLRAFPAIRFGVQKSDRDKHSTVRLV
jgi:hypothetical protein